MNPSHNPWQSLTAQARRAQAAQPAEDVTMPLGFATRVVARWRAAQASPTFVFWQRWSLRGACAAMLAYALVATLVTEHPTSAAVPVLDVPIIPNL